MFTKLIMSVCLSACSLSTTNAQSPVDTFYRSKNIQLILGVNVGGRYDTNGYSLQPTCAHSRMPMERIVSDACVSFFHASHAASTIAS